MRTVVALTLFLSALQPAAAARITALPLPPGFTVKPEGTVRLVSIAPDHTVAAASESTDTTWRARAFRWDPSGSRSAYVPLAVLTAPDRGLSGIPPRAAAVAAGPGVVYVSASESFSGAYSGESFEVQRWTHGGARRWHLPACVSSGDDGDQHAYAVDADGRIALTMDITGGGSFLVANDATGRLAPYAFVIEGERCRALGRGVVVAVRGRWAAGYRGYLDGHPAATNINTIVQHYVALRWDGTRMTPLGDGAAYGVNAQGLAVGATAPAGRFESMTTNFFGGPGRRYDSAVPHAVAWDARGRRIPLEHGARRSVAYDVADDGTVVGTLQAADGKHYAFLRRAGRTERLDALPHPPGWRFEAAYAIAPDGTIAGIGTYRGIATVFTWRG